MKAKTQLQARPRPAGGIEFITIPEMMASRKIRSRTTIYTLEANGLLPPLVKVGANSTGLPTFEWDAVNEALALGASQEMIRLLVNAQKSMRKARMATLVASTGSGTTKATASRTAKRKRAGGGR